MKFAIGTTNSKKVDSALETLKSFVGANTEIVGAEVDSGVPETPWDDETKQGAFSRATRAQNVANCEYALGIESGLVERYGEIYEEAWCCLITKGKITFGYSSGLKVPDIITKRMKSEGLKHYEVMRLLRTELGQPNDRDTWGNYSHKMLVRNNSYNEALRNALVQVFAPKESLYHK